MGVSVVIMHMWSYATWTGMGVATLCWGTLIFAKKYMYNCFQFVIGYLPVIIR